MKRRATIALCVVTLVGCENMGLDYAGTGEEGRNRASTDLVSSVHRAAPAATQPVIVDGRRWVPAGKPIRLDAAELRSVGSSGGQTLYARQWDDAPFDMLFIRSQPRGSSAPQPSPQATAPQPGAAQDTDAQGHARQPTGDTVSDPAYAGAAGAAGSPGTAGVRGTSGPSGPAGEAEWQPLVPVIGEDGGPPAQEAQPAQHEQSGH